MFRVCFLFGALLAGAALRAQDSFPLSEVHPGLRGVGRTVFHGNQIEEFQVEILGLLENMSPKQTIILARLSGGPLAQTGILQGMSGSPVYIQGRLLGAVALGFPFSKEPIAGIQPIDSMTADASLGGVGTDESPSSGTALESWRFGRGAVRTWSPGGEPALAPVSTPFGNLNPLLTPLALSGFTPAAVGAFSSDLLRLGFQPLAGRLSLGAAARVASAAQRASEISQVVPGSMISVGLLSGDMNMTADGTVTLVHGNRVYAFGHRFLDTGSTELPFAHSEVVALIPSVNSSFKLSAPGEWIGTILSDRATAVAGELGRSAETVPLAVTVESPRTGTHDYHFQVVNDRLLTPFITQAALFSVVDATERTLGAGTLQLEGKVEWAGNIPPLNVRDTFVADSGLVQQVSSDAVVPLGFVLGGGFRGLRLKSMSFHLQASEQKRQLHIAQAWLEQREVRPGESVTVTALLQGENGLELTRSTTFHVPVGAPTGPLNFTISDANTLNFPEFAGLNQSVVHDPARLIQTINSFRDNDRVFVRVWRQQPSFTISGPSPNAEISDPPPSVALILADPTDSATTSPAQTLTRGSALAELSIRLPGYVVSGAKTLQVEVKE